MSPDLANSYRGKAIGLHLLGKHEDAAALLDKAIAILKRLVDQENRHELSEKLASAYSEKASLLWVMGNDRDTAKMYDKAVAILEPLVKREGQQELLSDLATAYSGKADAVHALGYIATPQWNVTRPLRYLSGWTTGTAIAKWSDKLAVPVRPRPRR